MRIALFFDRLVFLNVKGDIPVCSPGLTFNCLSVSRTQILARIRLPKNELILSIVWKRYNEKAVYKLRKAKLAITFIVKCQKENITLNFLEFRLAKKNFETSATTKNVNIISNKQKLITRNYIWELCKMNSIVCAVICAAHTSTIFPVVMIIFHNLSNTHNSIQ